MSEINVTPFVDVMLVLLIIFMVAAPLLTVGVPVDLPKVTVPVLPDREPIVITVKADGNIFLQETETTLQELGPRMTAIAGNGYDQRIFIRADTTLDYGNVMQVMGTLTQSGFTRIGLVTEQALSPAPPPGQQP
jgi:biopolymer transport protein TolR